MLAHGAVNRGTASPNPLGCGEIRGKNFRTRGAKKQFPAIIEGYFEILFGKNDRACAGNWNFAPEIAPETGILHRKQDFAPEIAPEIENLHRKLHFLVRILQELYQICHKIAPNCTKIFVLLARSLAARQNPLPHMAASPEGIRLLFPAHQEPLINRAAQLPWKSASTLEPAARHAGLNWLGRVTPLKTQEKPIKKKSPPYRRALENTGNL